MEASKAYDTPTRLSCFVECTLLVPSVLLLFGAVPLDRNGTNSRTILNSEIPF